MSKFDELEERMFGAPIVTLPHVAHTSESASAFNQPQYERSFHYYLDQHGRFIYDNQSELVSSVPETNRVNSGGVSTKLPAESYCYFVQDDKLIFRKKPELVSSTPETDRTNSGGVSTILPTATYIPNSVCTSQTDDGTTAPHASLPHIMVLPNSPKSSCMTPMPEASCDASQTDSQKFNNWF
jgi:hypothetical protein